jgi:hypothetical protein
MQYQESEITSLKQKKDKDLTASERAALVLHKGGKMKARERRQLLRAAKRQAHPS